MYFGKNIKYLRKKLGLTQKDVADRLKVVPTTVGGWEKEDSYPYFEVLLEMRKWFDVNLESLVFQDLENIENAFMVEEGVPEYRKHIDAELLKLQEEVKGLRKKLEASELATEKVNGVQERMSLLEKEMRMLSDRVEKKD